MVNTATESVGTEREIAVQLSDVSKIYGEEPIAISALDHATLEVPKGEFVVLLGPSGSGKTTLLNVVGGIEPPTSGQIFVNSVDVSALSGSDLTSYRRDQLGFVFQFFNLIPTLTALENVQLIAELTESSSGDRSRNMLQQVGLGERINYFPGTLSGGEQQRVAIARALVKQPSVLLCDEPTGALDLETGRQVLGLLHRVNRQQSITILLVTHNSAIAEMADRVVRMRSGKIIDASRVESPVPAEDVTW